MPKRIGTLFVVPIINAMGPVTDSKHDDLLSTWDEVDRCVGKIFDPSYRSRYKDTSGHGAIFSWFFISWSGFRTNPVRRDFGYFTIYDHYRQVWGKQIRRFGDALYWMYNHPPASGVGNEWGLDWLHNTHYFNILNRYLIERSYFPAVVQVPTEKNDTSNWLENWFPFDVGNRNCRDLDLTAIEADGKITGTVIDWSQAPVDWSEYHPNFQNYRLPGTMKRIVFRMLDIKTRIYQLKEYEIEKAFQRCMMGKNTLISAYEHDFRDRAKTIMERFLEPITRLSREYPEVEWRYDNALNAAKGVLGYADDEPPVFDVECYRDPLYGEVLRIRSSKRLFGPMPYVASKALDTESYKYHPVASIGENVWQLDRDCLPSDCIVGVAASDEYGNVGLRKYLLKGNNQLQPL